MIKTGGAGSIPASDTIQKSQYLSRYLDSVGHSIHYLNSICVGLDAVKNGHKKPDGLDVTWAPNDPEISAIKSRWFSIDATIVFLAEATYEYFLSIGQFNIKLNREKGCWKESEDKSIFMKRVSEELLSDKVPEDARFLFVIPAITHDWRNCIVHSKANPKRIRYENLIQYESQIRKNYKNLSISNLLDDFVETRATLKDVCCLVAMNINLIKAIDEALYECESKMDYLEILEAYGVSEKIKKLKSKKRPHRLDDSIRMLIQTEYPTLLSLHDSYY